MNGLFFHHINKQQLRFWGIAGCIGFFLVGLILLYNPQTIHSLAPSQTPGINVSPSKEPAAPSPSSTPTPLNTASPTPIPPSPTIIPPSLTATSTPVIPEQYQIQNIHGHIQKLALSCEARSAVDWANFFGTVIDEMEFFSRLPSSDNPETGFVGSPQGAWGNIPPDSYGVHAGPVAERLHAYGLPARAVRQMTYPQLQTEIASNRPVMVWIVGHVWSGKSQWYTPSDGSSVLVAPYEHTVIVTGYNGYQVTILDNKEVYPRRVSDFLRSWSVLENMAIIYEKPQ
jgi:uncharacterized protein YvpB